MHNFMAQYIPSELALVRATAHQADELADLLGDDSSDHSQLLNQLQSILETREAGVDLLIELRRKLESNAEFYKERAKAIKGYAQSMERAKSFVDESIIALSNELGNRLEGSAEAICIQDNPVKVECLVDTTDIEQMEYLCVEYPHIFTKEVTVTYSFNKDYVKSNQDKPEVHKYFNFTQGKHIRVRRSQNPKALPQS
jgi:hypothetical protein